MQTNNIKHYKIMNEAYVSLETAKLSQRKKDLIVIIQRFFYKNDKIGVLQRGKKKVLVAGR